jgi:hypothetical protein
MFNDESLLPVILIITAPLHGTLSRSQSLCQTTCQGRCGRTTPTILTTTIALHTHTRISRCWWRSGLTPCSCWSLRRRSRRRWFSSHSGGTVHAVGSRRCGRWGRRRGTDDWRNWWRRGCFFFHVCRGSPALTCCGLGEPPSWILVSIM